MKIKLLLIIVLIQSCYTTAMFSELNQSSVYINFSNIDDNIKYYVNNDTSLSDKNINFQKVTLGYVLKGVYDFSLQFIDNKSSINETHIGGIYLTKFNYFLKAFDKLPVDLNLGCKYLWSKNNNIRYNALTASIYKNLLIGDYPSTVYLDITSINYLEDMNESIQNSNINIQVGYSVKLVVDKNDNNVFKDVISIGFVLNTYDFDKYGIGINLGLYHPIE